MHIGGLPKDDTVASFRFLKSTRSVFYPTLSVETTLIAKKLIHKNFNCVSRSYEVVHHIQLFWCVCRILVVAFECTSLKCKKKLKNLQIRKHVEAPVNLES